MSLITTHPAPIIESAQMFTPLQMAEDMQSQVSHPTLTRPDKIAPGERCT